MLVRSDGMVPMRVVRCGVIHRHGRHLRHKGRCIVASLPVSGVKERCLACAPSRMLLNGVLAVVYIFSVSFCAKLLMGGCEMAFDKAPHTCINHF